MGFGNFLPGFTIWRASGAHQNGHHTQTMADTGQVVEGRLSPVGASERIEAGAKEGLVTHRFSCASSVTVKVGDEVRGGSETVTVDAVRTTSGNRRKECLCVAIQTGAT